MAKVLIIDDNDELRDTLTLLLEDEGYEVTSAIGGKSGLIAFEQFRPDVVLTDVIMPEGDGIEAIRLIRAADPSARIIAMSGGSLVGTDRLRIAKALGAMEVLRKPFEVEELVQTVSYCLQAGPSKRADVA